MDCSFICVALEVNLRRQLMGKRIDYRFRALISVGSTDEVLVKYLRSKDLELSEKNMVLWAAAAYWLPLALQKNGCSSNGQLKQSARTAIYKLRQHINFLAQTFGLENELETNMIGAISSSAEQEIPTSRLVSPQAFQIEDELVNRLADLEQDDSYQLTAQPVTDQPETTLLLHHNDDKTFEALFVQ